MKKHILILVLCLATIMQSFAWGGKGHDITAFIAEQNLSKKAKKQVVELLDGHSLVYYSSWADSSRYTDEYKHTTTWHYRNVDEGYTVETMPMEPKGDVVTAVEDIIEKLENRSKEPMSREEEKVALMFLIHFVGDLHCPMHAGRKSDLGGNRRTIYFFGRKTNLHSIWDSAMIESTHNWSYSEWCSQLDILSKEQKSKITEGEPLDWFEQTYETSLTIYEHSPEEGKFSYDYVNQFAPILESQLLNAGLRLASILNSIYG